MEANVEVLDEHGQCTLAQGVLMNGNQFIAGSRLVILPPDTRVRVQDCRNVWVDATIAQLNAHQCHRYMQFPDICRECGDEESERNDPRR